MKRKLILFLAFAYLFTSTEFSEMLKIPFLFEHFSEHHHSNKTITFGDFLYMHYINHPKNLQGKHNHDDEKDCKLPFHSHSDCNSFSLTYFMPTPSFKIVSIAFEEHGDSGKIFFDNQFLRSFYTPSIWQPPQIS